MGSKPRRRAGGLLNLTPLIDVVFLLLIFFMLTSHFVEEESIAIELPQAASSSDAEDDGFVEVLAGADGKLRLGGATATPEEVTLERLEPALRAALAAPGKHSVRLRGDREARLGLAVQVMDAARKAGARSLDILTEQP
jgi:biopolymer transport protein ExbD